MKSLGFVILLLGFLSYAQADQQFEFEAFTIPEGGRIVLPVVESESLSDAVSQVDKLTGGAISRAIAEAEFLGEANSTLTLLGVAPFSRVDLVGLGKEAIDRVAAENFGGIAASLHGELKGDAVQILWPSADQADGATAARVAFGYLLRSYRFDRYMSEPVDKATLPVVRLLSSDESKEQFDQDLIHLAKSVYFARDMSSEPGNVVYPQSFVKRVKEQAADLDNLKIKVLDEKDIQRLNMGALWGVGKGSSRPPRLLVLEYMAGGDEAPVALVGKGITFDTGGISLKPNNNMWMMKGDLGGASIV